MNAPNCEVPSAAIAEIHDKTKNNPPTTTRIVRCDLRYENSPLPDSKNLSMGENNFLKTNLIIDVHWLVFCIVTATVIISILLTYRSPYRETSTIEFSIVSFDSNCHCASVTRHPIDSCTFSKSALTSITSTILRMHDVGNSHVADRQTFLPYEVFNIGVRKDKFILAFN